MGAEASTEQKVSEEKYDEKYDNKSEADNDDTEQEVIVNDGDFRRQIYRFVSHRDLPIIKCIGQIEPSYNYNIKHSYRTRTPGTGTAYRLTADSKKVFVVTCAHNVRRPINHCTSCNTYNNKNKCSKCGKTCNSKKVIKPTCVEFHRYTTTNKDFGQLEDSYECQVLYVPDQYDKNRASEKGYDFAILIFDDHNDNYYAKNCHSIKTHNGVGILTKYKRFSIFGYPGKDYGEAKKDLLYGDVMKSDAEREGIEFIKCDTKHAQFVLRQRYVDTSPGQSGAAVFTKTKNECVILGIHVGGHEKKSNQKDDYSYNRATLLSERYIKIMNNITENGQTLFGYPMIDNRGNITSDTYTLTEHDFSNWAVNKIMKKINFVELLQNQTKDFNQRTAYWKFIRRKLPNEYNGLVQKCQKKVQNLQKRHPLLIKTMSFDEISAIYTYTATHMYRKLNISLDEGSDEYASYCGPLFSGLSKLPFNWETTYFPAQSKRIKHRVLTVFKIGAIFVSQHFRSSTEDLKLAERCATRTYPTGCVFEIENSIHARNIQPFSMMGEKEFVFFPNTHCLIKDIYTKGQQTHIKCEEISFPWATKAILWIDNSPQQRKKIMETAEANGVRIVHRSSMNGALACLDFIVNTNEKFNVFVIDQIDGCSGAVLVEELKKRQYNSSKICIYTQKAATVIQECKDNGVYDKDLIFIATKTTDIETYVESIAKF
eukprot:70519_1